MHEPSMRKGSVSLADVIIVFVVVVVIAVILIPLITMKKTRPHGGRCSNNLKELGIALQLYWNDYDANLPSSALVRHSTKWNKRDYIRFATKRGVAPVPGGRRSRTLYDVLYDHMKNKDIVWCPEDEDYSKEPDATVSYWYKLAIDKAWYGENCTKPCRNEKDFAYNADQIAFYEHRGWHFDGGKGLENEVQINVVYLDSHVKTIALQNATSGNAIDCAANANGEPMYFNYDTKSNTALPKNTPAKYVDPGRYIDNFR